MANEYTPGAGTAGSGPGGVRGAARDTMESVKEQASGLAGKATEQGKTILSRQKDTAAEKIDSVAQALNNSVRQLEGDQQATASRYVGLAAERIEAFGRTLRDKDVDTLLHDAQDAVRRAPVAYFAGTVVAGFLLSRFLKASSERGARKRDWSSDSMRGTGDDLSQRYGTSTYDADDDVDLRTGASDSRTGTGLGGSTGMGSGSTGMGSGSTGVGSSTSGMGSSSSGMGSSTSGVGTSATGLGTSTTGLGSTPGTDTTSGLSGTSSGLGTSSSTAGNGTPASGTGPSSYGGTKPAGSDLGSTGTGKTSPSGGAHGH